MADTSDIYDLFYPSPPALKELASISATLELWRQEINHHRTENRLASLDLKSNRPQSLNNLIPLIPSAILSSIEKYITVMGLAIDRWLQYQFGKRESGLKILANFVDLVCDFDGQIDLGRTAKRMIQCDKISNEIKFHIACFYCFEEDIFRIWPEVESYVDVIKIEHTALPQNFYWICRLKNQLYKYNLSTLVGREVSLDVSLDEAVLLDLGKSYKCNWPALQYFLGRVDFNTWLRDILFRSILVGYETTYTCGVNIFSRYILAKLNAEQLRNVINAAGVKLMTGLSHVGMNGIAATWALIKNDISATDFNTIVRNILDKEGSNWSKQGYEPDWCEIWNGAPDHLKESFTMVLSMGNNRNVHSANYHYREVSFLLAVLSDQSNENRKTFWNNCWRSIILEIKLVDLRRVMELCFSDDDEITRFKIDCMSHFTNIRSKCCNLLKEARFSELNEFISFCCPKKSTARKVRQYSLRKTFWTCKEHVAKASLFSQFVDDAFLDSTSFKNELLASSSTRGALMNCMNGGHFLRIMEFVDLFATSEEVAARMKRETIVPITKQILIQNSYCETCDDWSVFMKWLLGDDEEIERYKHELNVDTLIQTRIRGAMWTLKSEFNKANVYDLFGLIVETSQNTLYNSVLEKFLEWYFVTSEALEEFKNKYAHDDIFMRFISK